MSEEKTKAELTEIIRKQRETLEFLSERITNPPIVIMSQTDVEKKYWEQNKELKKFKGIFGRLYWKCN